MRTVFGTLLVAAACGGCWATEYPSGVASVFWDQSNSEFTYKAGVIDPAAVAWANFSDAVNHPSGFGQLVVQTNAKFDDAQQMYAAGMVEGALTSTRIAQHWTNVLAWEEGNFANETIPASYKAWFEANMDWMKQQIADNPTDSRWQVISLILQQYDGVLAGYNSQVPAGQQLTAYDWMLNNAVGDFLDLRNVLTPSEVKDFNAMSTEELMDYVRQMTHCSALVKVTGAYEDMFAAHSSWFSYTMMLRVYKMYNFGVSHPAIKAQQTSYSSYPGWLSSLDDFYVNKPTNLVMLQTTNNVFNKALYKLVKPQSLLAWVRVRYANFVSETGKDWHAAVAKDNSGTYNNQYMLVDFSKFTPGASLLNDTLWTVEQIPGEVAGADTTQQLERGYWPSYNVAYFPDIYRKSGYKTVMEKHGVDFRAAVTAERLGDLAGIDYQLAPRAKIFRRDQGHVVNTTTFGDIMRYNDYENDPYANGDPWAAICSRGDLAASGASPDGCYDTKTTQASWMAEGRVRIINGPTVGGGNIKPFDWSDWSGKGYSHVGMPDVFDNSFEEVVPKWLQ